MKKVSLNQALLSLAEDIQVLKRVHGWRKPQIEICADFIDVRYRTGDTIRSIPVNHADEWRMFACNDDLYLVFTYYYEPDDEK